MKKLAVLLVIILIFLSGCGDSSDGVIRYDISGKVTNLDPQFATDPTARMIIANSFDGLYRQLPSGEVQPELAESHKISDDGLTHTITIKQGTIWQKAPTEKGIWTTKSSQWKTPEGVPVTAHNFVFSLQRLFGPNAQSPFAEQFSLIKGASKLLHGQGSVSELGVRALDDYTLEIQLEQPDTHLNELLASSAAMPCNQAFFESTRARYGMDLQSLNFNGPFSLRSWSEQLLSLRQNPQYRSENPLTCMGADFYILTNTDSSSIKRFFDGDTDASRLSYAELARARKMGGEVCSFEDTVWVLALNPRALGIQGNEIPRAIAHVIDRELFSPHLTENLRTAYTLIPPAVASGELHFREFAGEQNADISYDLSRAKQLYQEGLTKNELKKLPLTKLLICNEGNQALLAGCIQNGLQKLSIYTALERVNLTELLKRVNSGEFEAAIFPLSATYSSPDALLSYFRSGSASNFTGYHNPAFDTLLNSIEGTDPKQHYERYVQAERILLEDGGIIPLYFETTYYATAKGVSGVSFSPFLSGIYFRDAHKD